MTLSSIKPNRDIVSDYEDELLENDAWEQQEENHYARAVADSPFAWHFQKENDGWSLRLLMDLPEGAPIGHIEIDEYCKLDDVRDAIREVAHYDADRIRNEYRDAVLARY